MSKPWIHGNCHLGTSPAKAPEAVTFWQGQSIADLFDTQQMFRTIRMFSN
jgi:hypothetical protein